MPQYRYKARDRSGIAVTGVVEAESSKAVSLSLRELDYQIVFVREFSGPAAFLQRLSKQFQRQSARDVIFFTRQLALMVRSGLPLVDAIQSTAVQTTSLPFRKALILLLEDLKGGSSFSEALAHHPRTFSNLMVSMVRAGEAAGVLGEVLDRLATLGEEELELRGRIRSAIAYPVLLTVMSLGIVMYLVIAVLPRFVGIFEEAGAALPLPTMILMGISRFLQAFWFLLPLGLSVAVFSFRRYARKPHGRHRLHTWLLAFPVIGNLVRKTILTQFCRVMGSLLRSGIQAVSALTITQDVVGNEAVRRALEHIRVAVIGGSNLAETFRMSQVFPPTLVQMVSVGERTGTLEEILLRLSDFYDAELERDLRTLTSTLEPALLLIMGLLVGFIALSVLLPIFQLVQLFKR